MPSTSTTDFLPNYIVIDYETELDGRGSIEFWHPRFRVVSAAFSWFTHDGSIKSEYVETENGVFYFLERAVRCGVPLVAHNVPFEMGVTACRFPEIFRQCVWHADTMRLVQVYDNGGDAFAAALPPSLDEQLDRLECGENDEGNDDDEVKWIGGLGLSNAVQRVLSRPDHKAEAYAWIRENVPECRGNKEGSFLNRLPSDILERYNVGDTEETLRLYAFLIDHFASIGYDWRLDHGLYLSSAHNLVDAQIRGVRIDREALANYAAAVEKEIEDIARAFIAHFAEPIRVVERQRCLDEVRKRKTLRGRKTFLMRLRMGASTATRAVAFNVGSNKQLGALFVDALGMEPKFRTDKGAPSFRSAVLSQWGEGGEMLRTRRKRLLVFKQAQSLLALSAEDGRWHLSLKACGTATGRFSGGSHT